MTMLQEFVLKDSGKRQDFETGSRRDTREGKGRFDLIPPGPLERLAQVYERGAVKYGDRNWEKGQPLSRYLDSCMRHTNAAKRGLEDEDHLMQAAWNLFALAWTLEEVRAGRLPSKLNDLPYAGPLPGEEAPTKMCGVLVDASEFEKKVDYTDDGAGYTGKAASIRVHSPLIYDMVRRWTTCGTCGAGHPAGELFADWNCPGPLPPINSISEMARQEDLAAARDGECVQMPCGSIQEHDHLVHPAHTD
jgi:hypothetical protein